MKATLALAAVLFACVGFAPIATPVTTKVTGDYVEARTASVFAGACHYNGELVTTGDEAILAWNFSRGTWKGVDLTGVKAMAAVGADASLGFEKTNRKAELVVDTGASAAQVAAVTDLIRSECGKQIGSIVAVHRAPISFAHTDKGYTVSSTGFASMTVQPMPDDECCKQPSLVWYSPLSPVENRKVGYTTSASYSAGRIGEVWQRGDENSAFYGKFSF